VIAPNILEIDSLAISFGTGRRQIEVVQSVNLTVGRGETVGLVGESGSGKTVTSLASIGLLGLKGARVTSGRIVFDGQDMSSASEATWRSVRGAKIGMVFQQPMRSLNPALTVGEQIAEVLRRHKGLDRRAAWRRAVELLDRVNVTDAERRAHDYPHQFSGGMCQRVSIAIAVACEPSLIIADEPTTALDVTVQRHILNLFRELTSETGASLLYISHDLAVVADVCDRVTVMYAGQTVETGTVHGVFERPQHPYTAGLIAAIPRPGTTSLSSIAGRVPPPDQMPTGCRFHPRCPHSVPGVCDEHDVALVPADAGSVRCARASQLDLTGWVAT